MSLTVYNEENGSIPAEKRAFQQKMSAFQQKRALSAYVLAMPKDRDIKQTVYKAEIDILYGFTKAYIGYAN